MDLVGEVLQLKKLEAGFSDFINSNATNDNLKLDGALIVVNWVEGVSVDRNCSPSDFD